MVQIGLFSSITFISISCIGILFFKKDSWKALLIACVFSLGLFYPVTLILFLGLSGITYVSGYFSIKSKKWIGIAVIFLISILIFFKSLGSLKLGAKISLINYLSVLNSWQLIGLSFFLFNAISYLLDIKRGIITPSRSFFKLTLYLIYFPTLHSGPLHRYNYMMGQFNQIEITERSLTNGLRLMLWGFFKNIVIAQRLNLLIEELKISHIGGLWTLLMGLVFFFYIYFSFSSFVDFFQGVSEVFNVRIKDNFMKRIYFSSNRHEFWNGWHITLNEWFRDYIFYNLMKYAFWRKHPYPILLLTFLLIGLWHGINLHFLIWGILNGVWIIVEKIGKVSQKINQHAYLKVLGIIYHISICSLIALVFIFPSIQDLIDMLRLPDYFPWEAIYIHRKNIVIILSMFILVDIYQIWSLEQRMDSFFENSSPLKRRMIYLQLLICILLFGVFNGGLNNYYIQF